MGRKSSSTGREGFTLIEFISVLAIFLAIMIALLAVFKPQVQILKAKDSQRKSDLNSISKALEDYLNDNPCYPDASVFADCGGEGFRPYLRKIPCDPVTKEPYLYEKPECQKFVAFTTLSTENRTISYLDKGNYVVTSPNYRLVPETIGGGSEIPVPTDTPVPTLIPVTPSPTPAIPGYYGCFQGQCLRVSEDENCATEYMSELCFSVCGTPENPQYECHP